MAKPAKATKKAMEMFSSAVSSGVLVDQYDHSTSSIIKKSTNFFKNRFYLSQTESVFLDFKRKTFPNLAISKHVNLHAYLKEKNKVELMKLLSYPLYENFKGIIKQNDQSSLESYCLYPEISDAAILQSRIYNASKSGVSSSLSWHQVTVKFYTENKEFVNVFERREIDNISEDQWRICYLE